MNSNSAVVSQVLLSLETDLSNSQPFPRFHNNLLAGNYDSQSTYDSGSLTRALNDDRSPVVVGSQLTSTVQSDVCDDETQHVEKCPGAGLEELASSLTQIDRTYYENSVTLSADNSPSLLEPMKPFRFMSFDKTAEETNISAIAMNAAAPTDTNMADVEPEAEISQLDNSSPSLLGPTKLFQFMPPYETANDQVSTCTVVADAMAEAHMHDVEPEVPLNQDIGQLDASSVEIVSDSDVVATVISLLASTGHDHKVQLYGFDVEPEILSKDTGQLDNSPSLLEQTVCGVNDNLLASVPLPGNVSDQQVPHCGADFSKDVPVASSEHVSYGASCVPAAAQTGSISSFSSASLQVDQFVPSFYLFQLYTYISL